MPVVGLLVAVPAETPVKVRLPPTLFNESAVPVVVASELVEPVTLTVPPPVAVKAGLAPVTRRTAPLVKLIVAPVLLVSEIPVPPPVIAVTVPLKATVPPVRFLTSTVRPPELLIEPP